MYMYMHFKNKTRIIIYCSYMIFPESSTSKTNDLEPNITVHLWSYAAVFSYILVVNAKISASAEHYSVKTFMNQKWKELVLVKIKFIIIIQWASGEPNHYFFPKTSTGVQGRRKSMQVCYIINCSNLRPIQSRLDLYREMNSHFSSGTRTPLYNCLQILSFCALFIFNIILVTFASFISVQI